MSTQPGLTETPSPFVIHMHAVLRRLSDSEFYEFCRQNPDWRFERTSEGDLIIMTPTGSETGRRGFELSGQFAVWVQKDGSGVGFDSSAGFILPNTAVRSPDLAWIRRSRWEQLSQEEREQFAPLCPDFVVEIRSRTDSIETLQAKMREYIDNGAQLGWLIDPLTRTVQIYRPGEAVVYIENVETVTATEPVAGFVLDLSRIW